MLFSGSSLVDYTRTRSVSGPIRFEWPAARTYLCTTTIPNPLSALPNSRCSRPSALSGAPFPASPLDRPIPDSIPSNLSSSIPNELPTIAVTPYISTPHKHVAKAPITNQRRGSRAQGRGPQHRGSPPSAAAAAARTAADALFLDPDQKPLQAPRYGPVQIAELDGERGWGLVTRRTVHPGELLLAVRPLALAWDEPYDQYGTTRATSTAVGAASPAGTPSSQAALDPTDAKFLTLQRQLLNRRYTPREASWLASLGGLPPLPAPSRPGGGGREPSRPGPPSLEEGVPGEEGDTSLPLPPHLTDLDTLADVVQANYQQPDAGMEDEEVFWARREAAAEGGEEEGVAPGLRVGPMGLWPEAAMLNHSCIPNTVSYVVGDVLFVRAARKIGSGSELTTSYLPVGGVGTVVDSNTTLGAGQQQPQKQGSGSDPSSSVSAGWIIGEVGEQGDEEEEEAGLAAGGGGGAGGGEVEGSLLSPLAVRRGALEAARGFWCTCSRCTAEEQLDPQLQQLMSDVWAGVQGLREDLEYAQMLAAEEEEVEEEEGEEAVEEKAGRRSSQQQAVAVGGRDETGYDDDSEEDEEDEEEEEGGGSRWRQLMKRAENQALLYTGFMDAAFTKLKLTTQQQLTAQCALAPLYMSLWTATSARGYLEPQLAEVLGVLVGEVAPGSAEHLWWTAVARDTAEMIVAVEEEAEVEEDAEVTRGFGASGRGFRRLPDPRVVAADKDCYSAYSARYGPISRSVYGKLMAARRQRQDEQAM